MKIKAIKSNNSAKISKKKRLQLLSEKDKVATFFIKIPTLSFGADFPVSFGVNRLSI